VGSVKTRVIPVIIWATGIISRLFGKCLTNIPRKHETEEPQKNSHFGHCTHTAESAGVEVQNIQNGK